MSMAQKVDLKMVCERPPSAPPALPCISLYQGESRQWSICWFTVPLIKGDSRGAAGGRSHTVFKLRESLLSIACILVLALPMRAWNATGHMTTAYIAYQRLDPSIRTRVDTLLKLNPEYQHWTAGAPAGEEGLVAFINAAVWPDCIKGNSCPGYSADGPNNGNTPPSDPSASRNIGYADRAMHKYWHFIDHPYAPTGLLVAPPPAVNAATEIKQMRTALQSAASDYIKSYDVAWLEHLVADVHQPLHAISRFTALHPMGDAGGNLVRFCDSPCDAPDNLHAYWDDLMGNQTDIAAIRIAANDLLGQPEPAGAESTDLDSWTEQSAALAKRFVYTAPISAGNDPQVRLSPRPDAGYAAEAHRIARRQILLAGYRLAHLLNANLK